MAAVRDYLPTSPAGRTFAVISLISAVGTGLFLAGSTIVFVRSVGLTTTQVGFGLAIAGAVGFLVTVPIGAVADRIGAQKTLVVLQLWRAGWFVGLTLVHGVVGFTLVASCLAAAEGATPAMSQAVAAATTEAEDRTRTMAIIRTVRNVGFSLGALLAAPLLTAESPWAYRGIVLGNAAAFVLAAGLLARLRLNAGKAQRKVSPLTAIRGFRDWRYLVLTAFNGVISLHGTILGVALPLWVLQGTKAPAGLVPVLVLVNTLMAIALQVPLSKGVDAPPGAARALRLGGFALAASCLALALAHGHAALWAGAALVVGVALLTFGEMWQAVGGWELSFAYAPEQSRGVYLSVFSLGDTGQRIAGPAVLTGLVIAAGPYGWVGLAVVLVAAALAVVPVQKLLERQHAEAPAAVPVTT
ncbi:MFS transporter [Kitasatospora sp. NPDC002227]|uniref:MFS transporter n=1 Tax=Kitasatospora sp. NPDC002227 TaxID=3154773 RepID=UPI003328C287